MVFKPPQATVCPCSQRLEPSSGVAQLAAEIAQLLEALRQLQQQIGVAADLMAPRFAITPERAWTVAADKATDAVSGVAQSKWRIVREQP